MRDRRAIFAVVAVFVALVVLVVLIYPRETPSGGAGRGRSFDSQDLEPPPSPPGPAAVPSSAGTPGASPAPSAGVTARPPMGSPRPAATGPANIAARGAAPTPPNPQTETDRVRHMVADYHTVMGENPVGTNAEIMHEIMGANPRQATFGPPEGQTLNSRGELVDPWGTPYFFHQLSRDVMEIHSAGPDKVMGTADDIVTR